ncbi:MAG TPA: ABC transporter ATP-binding protein [Gemmatimonadaceae bacterium]|nr:ABC transporter ATP-binding protein [Gemmatimonadaceae bacterium]
MAEGKKRPPLSAVRRDARELVWSHRGQLGIGLLIMLVNRAAAFVLPVSVKFFIDRVVGQHATQLLTPLALAVIAATLVQGATAFALSQVMSIAAQRVIMQMRQRIQRHVLRLPVSFFDSTQSGILISRIMNDAEGIRNLVGTGIVQLTSGLMTAIIALIWLFHLNWQLTAMMLGILLVFGGGMAFAFRYLRPIFRERNKITAEVTGRLAETLGGVRVVKTYVAERREQIAFAKGVHRLFRNIAQTITGTSAVAAGTTVIAGLISALLIIVGGHAILTGSMSRGDLGMYVALIGLIAAPLVQIASIGTQISEAFAGLDRLRELREQPTEDRLDAEREPVPSIRGDVDFEDVSFSYVEGQPVLRHVSFHADAGTTTALVGSSGSGKSTMLNLVMAFNRPQSGRILVDGRDLQTLQLRAYRAHLGVVLQDNFLFDGTIADNIRFGKPSATMEEIRAVSGIAHCDEFIAGFEHGYDTVIGERGVKLSGGQRQRVAIARAILADPSILILDEATSSLDSESEALIRDGLNALRRGRTTFVIAHRLSTIASADQILVVEGGEIVERGTHEELLAAGGRYRQLYDKQYMLERDTFINPGEDFTPEPERVPIQGLVRTSNRL